MSSSIRWNKIMIHDDVMMTGCHENRIPTFETLKSVTFRRRFFKFAVVNANDYVLRVREKRAITEERFMPGHGFTYGSCSLPHYSALSEKGSGKRSYYHNNRRGKKNAQINLKLGKGGFSNYCLSFYFFHN